MLGSEAVDEVQMLLGFRTDLADRILTTMQRGQRHLERNWLTRPLPHFLLTERASTSTVEDEERVALPSDFIEEWELDGLWFVDSNGGEHLLQKYDPDDLRELEQLRVNYGLNQSVNPSRTTHYAITGDYWRLFPAPDGVYTLKQMYYQLDSLVALDEENRWLKHAPYVLIGWAGERLALGSESQQIRQDFTNMKTAAIQALNVQSVEKQLTNRRMAMGENL